MDVQITVTIDGREVANLQRQIETCDGLELEQDIETLKNHVGSVLLEVGCEQLAAHQPHPCCCGRRMENRGRRAVTLNSQSGEFRFTRNRYRCRTCGRSLMPADAAICCGRHRITRLLARNVCQLATLEHFTQLEQLLADQHGVHLGHDPMFRLVHDVGGTLEQHRLAEVEHWQSQPPDKRVWPAAEVTPSRVSVSCDGIMFCTNQREPDPQHPGCQRMIWKQMRVGCVWWEDAHGHLHKRVTWGQADDYQSFGAALYRLACRCGYREAQEKIFAADGGEWCWSIQQKYFADAEGILDWYHAAEHVWQCGKLLTSTPAAAKAWVDQALAMLRDEGGIGLLHGLCAEHKIRRGKTARQALQQLINYVQPKCGRMEYARYRKHGWPIGTGLIESTAKQLVGIRLKGPGMHWTPAGATAITALRAQTINQTWHQQWKTLTPI